AGLADHPPPGDAWLRALSPEATPVGGELLALPVPAGDRIPEGMARAKAALLPAGGQGDRPHVAVVLEADALPVHLDDAVGAADQDAGDVHAPLLGWSQTSASPSTGTAPQSTSATTIQTTRKKPRSTICSSSRVTPAPWQRGAAGPGPTPPTAEP